MQVIPKPHCANGIVALPVASSVRCAQLDSGQRVNGPAAEHEHGATPAPVEDAGGRLLFAVVSHGHKDDGLIVSQG
jgi:hypothetical protein